MNDLYIPPTDDELMAIHRLRNLPVNPNRKDCEYQYAVVIYRGERQVERFCQHPEHWQPNCQIVEWVEFVEDVLSA